MADQRLAVEPGQFREALETHVRVIGALVLRETRTRFGKSRVGYLWAIVEPIIYVATFASVWTIMGRSPTLGNSAAEFLMTGILPYQTFAGIVSRTTSAISANKALLAYPIVKNVDTMIARIVLEMMTSLLVYILLFGGLGFLGITRIPDDPLSFVFGMLSLMLLGAGVGFFMTVPVVTNAAVGNVFPWVMRFAFFISGPFFILDQLPREIANRLAWNPIIHGIEWMRTAYFPTYASTHLDRSYILFVGLATLVLGLALERLARVALASE